MLPASCDCNFDDPKCDNVTFSVFINETYYGDVAQLAWNDVRLSLLLILSLHVSVLFTSAFSIIFSCALQSCVAGTQSKVLELAIIAGGVGIAFGILEVNCTHTNTHTQPTHTYRTHTHAYQTHTHTHTHTIHTHIPYTHMHTKHTHMHIKHTHTQPTHLCTDITHLYSTISYYRSQLLGVLVAVGLCICISTASDYKEVV